MTTLFFQNINYDRSKGRDGEFYVDKPLVRRAIVACTLSPGGTAYDKGYRAIVFITANDSLLSPYAGLKHKVFFATPEEAVAFARGEVSYHEYEGEPTGSMAYDQSLGSIIASLVLQ